jgi:O-Antigen ligase
MSAIGLSNALWRTHPAVRSRQRHELLVTGLAGSIAVAIALGIAIEVPNPNFFLAAGILVGTLGLVALAASVRYEVTLTFLALYLGLVDGVVKLETANQLVSSVRDIMIAAICLGAIARMSVRRERVRLPPLSGWVIAFVVLIFVEAFNPNTHGMLKILGGFRQQLEWIPFFFFGYILMRSKERFRKFFLILGMIALANGVVSTIQTQLTPAQLSKWGPGYEQLINGTGTVSNRVYTDSEGTVRVRPPALGSDFGFGGYVGVLALPGLLVLLGTGRLRRRWAVVLLCFGALLAVATSLQREAVLGAVIAMVAFAVLSASAGRRAARVLIGLLTIGALAFVLASLLAPDAGNGVFSRYASITPSKATTTSVNYREKDLAQIPTDIKNYPFGAGLATAGAAKSFGGSSSATIEGHLANAESQYNYVTLELGLPGLLLWVGLSIKVIVLVVRRLRRVEDVELRLSLAGIFAAIIAFTIMGFVGPTMSNLPFGPYFWFAVGIAAYWFCQNPHWGETPRASHHSTTI